MEMERNSVDRKTKIILPATIHEEYKDGMWIAEVGMVDKEEFSKVPKELVLCKDCKHRPKKPDWENYESGFDIEFPDGKCPCQCSGDEWYSWYPKDDWFCAEGERKEGR